MGRKKNGSITVWLCLFLPCCIALLLALLESARVWGLQSQLFSAAQAAVDSAFAGYDGDLFSEFGLLFLYKPDHGDVEGLISELEEYTKKNLDPSADTLLGGSFFSQELTSVQIGELDYTVSHGGSLFARAVLDLMKYQAVGDLTELVSTQLQLLSDGETAKQENEEQKKTEDTHWGTEIEEQKKTEQSQRTKETEETEELSSEEKQKAYEEAVEESLIGKMEQLKESEYRRLIIPENLAVSGNSVTKGGFPSIVAWDTSGYESDAELESLGNRILYAKYLQDYFHCFTDARETEGLCYEMEYILFGEREDSANLMKSIDQLLLMREGMNLLFLMGSSVRSAEAEQSAAMIAGWTGLSPVITATKYMIMAAWAYAESIVDARTLLGGGRVRLVKQEEDWSLSLGQALQLAAGNLSMTGGSDQGLAYSDYLFLSCMTQSGGQYYYRTMDMIQQRMRQTRADFDMAKCVYAMEVHISAAARPVFLSFGFLQQLTGISRYQYPIHITLTRMY